jgi:hypothetical protein
MNSRGSLLNALALLKHLSCGDRSLSELAGLLSCSVPTTKRAIALAKKLGAQIEVPKSEGGYLYQLKNWGDIGDRVEDWADRYAKVQSIEIQARIPNVLSKHE